MLFRFTNLKLHVKLKTYLHIIIFFVYDSAKYMSILRYKKHYFKLEKKTKILIQFLKK